jgi:hypothetical protein
MDISDCEKEFNEIHKREFETTWSFAEIESWLEDLSNDRLCTFICVCTFIPKVALLFENIVRVLHLK